MSWIKELLSDSGNVSCMRLMSILTVLTGLYSAITGHDVAMTATLLGIGMGGKTAQKFAEVIGASKD